MINTLAPTVAILLIATMSHAFAQSSRITTTTTTKKHDSEFSLGRDFWFSPAQNYLDESGKYYRIYITSPNQTTAHVASGGIDKAVPVPSFGIVTFNVPLGWEMKSSGIVENKAIHVYDITDDICVYLMSHNPYTSDGMYCIPTIGWGNDYVVAAYGSLFEGFGTYVYDFPSEFTISADQDNTVVNITPNCDLRQADIYPQNNSIIAFPKGVKFSITLNRGQSVQYQAVKAQDADNYDVTGTIIHSNLPIGVVGASACPNIPSDFPYCDHVLDMIPPVRTWGETYYTTNPTQPAGMTGHDFSLYLLISSVPNQEIDRADFTTGKHSEALLGPAFDHFFVEEESSNKWTSNAPFLLVQYLNSSTYPDDVNGNGDPAEVVIPAMDNFTKKVVFETPTSVGAQAPYDNYANVIVNVRDVSNVIFDGKRITSFTSHPIDSLYSIFVVPHITPAAHVVKSDSGVGVYVYGYGYDESYAWNSPSRVGTFNSPDIAPPIASFASNCLGTTVHLSDTGITASKLMEIRLDSDVNMAYMPDLYPQWLDGAFLDTSGYSMYVVDASKPAILTVTVYDAAGNRTIVTSTYTPGPVVDIEPALQDFGVSSSKDPAVILYDTLTNVGPLPIQLSNVSLFHGDVGFTIDSAISGDLAPGQKIIIKISFLPVKPTLAYDTLLFDEGCSNHFAALVGSGGGADFFVSDAYWGATLLPPYNSWKWVAKGALIHNVSKLPIDVDTFAISDRAHFAVAPGQTFPIHLTPYGTPGDTASAYFYFEPSYLSADTAIATWRSAEVKGADSSLTVKSSKLIGYGIAPALAFKGDSVVTIDCDLQTDTLFHFTFSLSNSGTAPAVINKVTLSNTNGFDNLMGHDQHGSSWDPAKTTSIVPIGAVDTFTVDFHTSLVSNISTLTRIMAFGPAGDTLAGRSVTAAININYWACSLSTDTIHFRPVEQNGGQLSTFFTITNTSLNNELINSPLLIGKYATSFSFLTIPPVNTPTPDTLLPGQSFTVIVVFDPTVNPDPVQEVAFQITTNECPNAHIVPIFGLIGKPNDVTENITPPFDASIRQLNDGKNIRVSIPSDWTGQSRFEIFNILGDRVFISSIAASSTLDMSDLTKGVYFYRLRNGENNQTGKILMGQ